MKKKSLILFSLFLGFPFFSALAKTDYIYRQRVNWVKIDKADPKEIPLSDLRHPSTVIEDNQMEAMLLSIKISKKHLLKKEVDSIDVFNTFEARKYSSYLVNALARVGSEEVVNFSIVHKRPLFILRNDRLTMGNLFVAGDGVHFQFTKLFAKLSGDYEASANMDKMVRKAKTIRVSLEANEGQVLSYASATEIILSPTYDFIKNVQIEQAHREEEDAEAMKTKSARKDSKEEIVSSSNNSAPPVISSQTASGDAPSRLRKLEDLKKQKLISDQEYQDLRKKILSEL